MVGVILFLCILPVPPSNCNNCLYTKTTRFISITRNEDNMSAVNLFAISSSYLTIILFISLGFPLCKFVSESIGEDRIMRAVFARYTK